MRTDPDLGYVAKMVKWQEAIDDSPKINQLAAIPIQARSIYVEHRRDNEYPDYFERPIMLVSKGIKQVFSMYQEGIEFRLRVLNETESGKQVVYYSVNVPVIDCAKDGKKDNVYASLSDIVLDTRIIGFQRVFTVSGFPKNLIVRLDVAESILRRSPYGVTFDKMTASSHLK